ncbi:elongation factor P-like isoform X1 [Oryza brachyantha]|uniref:elongation factor P-like isoform X1 n=1 Tax=Oryza brachyantha TaxID=4533 RepID=UPI001ADAAEE5|nr:elongation factor P-like isoform X1 [Oryza brachyantha]
MASSLRHLSTSAAAPHSFHRLSLARPPPLRSRLTRTYTYIMLISFCCSHPIPSQLLLLHFLSQLSGVYALSSNDIRVGSNIEVDGAPWKVLEFLHVKPGKGAAFVRTKMRNYITGNTVDKTFRAGSTIPEASISKETKQFTYKDGSQFVFMDLTSFEETRLNESDVGDRQKWLKEGMDCNLLYWNGRIIDFDLPITVRLTVTDTDPGQGDSAQGGTKPATVETGAVVTVPSFVNVGDDILIDSRTGQYMNRA